MADRMGGATLAADAVVLACGGFQGDGTMMREHFGAGAEAMRLISPGTRHNTGDGIDMGWRSAPRGPATGRDACRTDRRAREQFRAGSCLSLRRCGRPEWPPLLRRGRGLVHETWECFARELHFKAPGSIAYAILDSRLLEIADSAARGPVRGRAPAAPTRFPRGAADRDMLSSRTPSIGRCKLQAARRARKASNMVPSP